jgi:hypothetical protein
VLTNHLEFVEIAGGVGRVEFCYPVTMPNVVQMTDFVLMRFVTRIRGAGGSHWRPVSVGLMHRQPADISEYERRLGSRIFFDQPVNSITIAAATLALPMPNADPRPRSLTHEERSGKLTIRGRGREAMTALAGSFGPKHVMELGLTEQPAAPAEERRHIQLRFSTSTGAADHRWWRVAATTSPRGSAIPAQLQPRGWR